MKLTKGSSVEDITKLSDYDYLIFRIFSNIISFMRFRGINKHEI